MKIKFHMTFDKNWIVFPLCTEWHGELMHYVVPAKRLCIGCLWWHCAWTFLKER